MGKDIDFDELDKAVNSLMGNVASDPAEEDPKAKTLKINSTLGPDEKPAYSRLDEVAKSIGNETLVLEGERTIVEDLDALQLAPSPEAPATPMVDNAPSMPPLPERPKQAAAPKPASGRFMDVVHPSSDMRTTSSDAPALKVPERDDTAAKAPVDTPAPTETAPAEITPVPQAAAEAPLTPFLPDAKVEKRPLGGAPATANEEISEPAEAQVEKTEEVVSPEVPSEPEVKPAEEPKEPETNEIDNIPPEAAESIRAVESGDTEKLSTAAQSGVPIAEQLSDSAQNEGAIYDVDNQPQPLGHPTKQKSGWGTVVIILIVILLSAALGAAAYFILGLGA